MKSIFTFLLITLFICHSYAQFGPQQIISTTETNAYRAIPADINGDGFMDIVSLSLNTNNINWYENLDGLGNFSTANLIAQYPALFLSFEIVDLDADGDLDILFIENNPNKLLWIENENGEGAFSQPQIILENQINYMNNVSAIDIDNDNDLDLIVEFQESFQDQIIAIENTGNTTFTNQIVLLNEIDLIVTTPIFEDIDDDGLQDMLISTDVYNPASIQWYKNLGNFNFGTAQLIYQFDFLVSDFTSIVEMNIVDINADGKKDILLDTQNDDFGPGSYWIEKLDNMGNYGDLTLRDFPIKFYYDIDNDLANDILFLNIAGNTIFWIENENNGTFTISRTISTEVINPRHVQAADFNGDGLLDVVSASSGDNKIAWYENTGVLNVTENTFTNFYVYPNPVNETLFIESETTIKSMSLFTILGQEVLISKATSFISLKNLSDGIYFLKVNFEDGSSISKKIIKQ